MTILDKVWQIYEKYYVCPHCLGRMFSLLGTGTTNLERGISLLLTLTMENHGDFLSGIKEKEENAISNLKILAEKANFTPAQKVLKAEGLETSNVELTQSCHLCSGIFEDLEQYVQKAKEISSEYEFKNFLVGASPDSQIINLADKFKAELNLLESESFKSHFNREVGKVLSVELDVPTEFSNPDIVFIYNVGFDSFSIDLNIKSLFISGNYNKLIRGIPQTRWICNKCSGKGCEECNNTGKIYQTSVEEHISPEFIKATNASDSKFHGAGREDIDVRMLGTGRPFVIELKRPKVRTINLDTIETEVNQANIDKIQIRELKYSNKKKVIEMKAQSENNRKTYKALTEVENNIEPKQFENIVKNLKTNFENQRIHQRTPNRVSHRRADKVREKLIYNIEGKYINSNQFEFMIETQGGTYIKELIHGDEGRTKPSFAEIFGLSIICKELDVIKIG